MNSPHSHSTERWQQIKAIVAEAIEEPSASARATLVRERCRSDAELLREVESLLDQTTKDFDAFAQTSAIKLSQKLSVLAPGQRLGPYEVVRELGRGGQGAVYLGRRADGEFERLVAIKVLKRGTDTDEVLQRFRGERQILGRLDHPNIARLFDAGTTPDGLPYFVMEHVAGRPITTYANEHHAGIRERLQLIQTVCLAVSYAHQNLVIHRDLKPANILITEGGEAKLLDFGIAKLIDDSRSDLTLAAQRRLTPEYASPEQVQGAPVTTSSDVYSLGIVLYELLTNCRPYKWKTATPEEMTKAIRVQQPARPSSVAKDNGRPGRIAHSSALRGDLDNIVMKAIAKEPACRYPTVERLADDIRRHLEGLPVSARKQSVTYRAGKFIRRHKIGVAATALLTLSLTAGIASTTIQARRATRRFLQVRRIAHSVLFDYHDAIAALPGSTAVRQRLVNDALEYLDNLSKEAGRVPHCWRN